MVKHTLWKEIHKLMKVQPLTLTTRRPLVWLTCMFQGQEFHFFHHATTRWREFFIWLKLPLKPEVQPKESICVSTIKQITNQKIYIYIIILILHMRKPKHGETTDHMLEVHLRPGQTLLRALLTSTSPSGHCSVLTTRQPVAS